MSNWIKQVSEFSLNKVDHVIVTLVNIKGSAPQEVASKMVINKEGLCVGTVGGGKIENHAILFAKELLK